MDKKELVLDVFKNEGKPLKTGDVAKILGLPSKEVSKIIKELKKDGVLFSPKRCYYAVKTLDEKK